MKSTVADYDDAKHRGPVIALWNEVFGYEAPHNAPALVIDRKLAVGDGLFLVALEADQLVGTIMAGYDGHRGWIYLLAVHTDRRSQGIGAMLLQAAERRLEARGCVKVNLQIMRGNEAVAHFYRSQGYVEEERISMGKRLPTNVPG